DLLQARRHRDPEIRARAFDLLCRFDRDLALERLKNAQRGRKLSFLAAAQTDPPPNTAATDGARFWFSRRPWAPAGEVLGTIIETIEESYLEGSMRWSVAGVRGNAEVRIETCAIHSPRLVYVPGVPPDGLVVTLRGTRQWRCDVPVTFRDPADGDTQ